MVALFPTFILKGFELHDLHRVIILLSISIFRCMWQRLSAVRMFIEHVYPSQGEMDPQDLQNILKLWKVRTEIRQVKQTMQENHISRLIGGVVGNSFVTSKMATWQRLN